MTLPTGGTINYTYTNFKDAHGNQDLVVTSRAAAGGTWQYSYVVTGSCNGVCEQQTTITKPSGDVTTYAYSMFNGAWPFLIQYYQGPASPANLMAMVQDVYDMSQPCPLKHCTGPAYIRKSSETVTLSPNTSRISKFTQYTYDSPQTGNVTAIKEWNGFSGTGTPVRATYITYSPTIGDRTDFLYHGE